MESKFFIALSMFVLIIRLSAQPYPVDAFVRMHPPFSPYLEDWSSSATSPVNIQLNLLDAAEQQYPVQLRFSWIGQGIKVYTHPNIPQASILLDFGVPTTLDASTMANYLHWDHLQFEGLDRNTFLQNGGRLPEGIYNFCVEVLDANRPYEAPLSNQACVIVQLEALPAPVLVCPSNGEQVEILPIQFQWFPQHLGTFPVSYTLRIFEDRPGLSPAQISAQTSPLFQINTGSQQQFLYDWDEPPLEPGKRYWTQVLVEDLLGEHLFQAGGFSELSSFEFGMPMNANCTLVPPELVVHQMDSQSFSVSWDQLASNPTYEIQLATDRSFQSQVSEFFTHSVTDTFVSFSGLLAHLPYYIRGRATAGECFSAYSSPIVLELIGRCQPIDPRDLFAYECGQSDQEIQLDAISSLPQLQVGDSIWANQFPLVVTAVQGKGPFFGEAYGRLSYLKEAQVNFQLHQIEIDQHCRLIAGNISVTGAGMLFLDSTSLEVLNNILAGLETLDDWLALSEEILAGVDRVIADVEPFLPASIIEDLLHTQKEMEQAGIAYEAALASGDDDAIQAALEKLNEARAKLKTALEAYKAALLKFLKTWLEVAGELFADLLQDCVWDQLRATHRAAAEDLQAFIKSDTEQALLQVPTVNENTLALDEEFEIVFIESDTTNPEQSFSQLTKHFYEIEMDYLICVALEKLEAEIQDMDDVAILQDLLKEINANSLAIIGEAIAKGLPTNEIVPSVKHIIYQDLQQLLYRSSYPSSITLSTQ